MLEVVLKRFENPDETRVFEKGRFDTVRIGGMTIGRASYDPGWKWSEHVAPVAGAPLCDVEHLGLVVSGRAVAAMSASGSRRSSSRATRPARSQVKSTTCGSCRA